MMHNDEHSAAPLRGEVRSSLGLRRRKRGRRSFHARCRRHGKLVHIQNSFMQDADYRINPPVLVTGIHRSDKVSSSSFRTSIPSFVDTYPVPIPSSSSGYGSQVVLPSYVPCISTDTGHVRSGSVFNRNLRPSDGKRIDLDSVVPSLSFSNISVLLVNIRGWRSHCDELSAYVSILEEKPKLIAVNESFLNESVKISLPGYVLVGRRDRNSSDINTHIDNLQSWGGILLFVASEFDGAVIKVSESSSAERLWFVLHCDVGPILLCVWYRPPAAGDISSICTLQEELSQLRNDVIGTAIIGDVNCHPRVGYFILLVFLQREELVTVFVCRMVFKRL